MVCDFQFNHTQVGLTYPQASGLTKVEIENFFLDWEYNGIKVDRYIIAMESHRPKEDDLMEGIHYHCYVHLTKRLRGRNCRLFDIIGIDDKVYHPHIDKIRGFKNMVKYITKEDEHPLANFEYKNNNEQPNWEELYSRNYESAEDFLNYLFDRYPKYVTSHYLNCRAIAYDRYEKKIEKYVPKYTVFSNVPFAAKCWVDNYLHGDIDRPLSLILIGPSRTGKTEWARSLGRHMYFNGYFNASIWDPLAEYAVFDDMDRDGKKLEEYFPNWKCWFGAQREFTITDKYQPKKKVSWGKPIIFISNNEIECNSKTLDYIRKNSIRINVHSEFF